MVNEFIFWLKSIFEETPLPDEIKYIVFEVHFAGKYKFVELRGYEEYPKENMDCFRPLEAQFFHCNNLAKLDDKLFIYKLKYIIEECLTDEFISLSLKGRSIFLYFNNKFQLLFMV